MYRIWSKRRFKQPVIVGRSKAKKKRNDKKEKKMVKPEGPGTRAQLKNFRFASRIIDEPRTDDL